MRLNEIEYIFQNKIKIKKWKLHIKRDEVKINTN